MTHLLDDWVSVDTRRGDAVEGGGGERRGVEVFDGALGRGGEHGVGGPRAGRVRGALETVGAPGIAGETSARTPAHTGSARDSKCVLYLRIHSFDSVLALRTQ
jgi:hypothetical protein